MRAALDTAARRSPAQLLFRARSARRLAVLAYHGIDDPQRFANHLEHVVRHTQPVSLDDVVAALRGGRELPPRAVLITFDDGYHSVLEHALPLLKQHGVKAVAFVLPGLVGTTTPFWWSEVMALVEAGGRVTAFPTASSVAVVGWLKTVTDAQRRAAIEELRRSAPESTPTTRQLTTEDLQLLESGGVSVENHTWTHPCLDRCDDDEVEHQVRAAHDFLATSLGRAPRAFAYPNGNWDRRAELILTELHYQVAFLFDHQLVDPATSSPLRVSRLRVNSDTSPQRFATIVSGLHPAMHRARGGR